MTTHCNQCGLPTAVLAIRGELSSQFVCRTCGHSFDRDNIGECGEFRTQARPQAISLASVRSLPAIVPAGAMQP